MSVAATKSVTTLTALKEKTGADRKTLRAINEGRPVKEATLHSIADRLRVPLDHLLTAEKREVVRNADPQYREIKLQQLDAAALRKLAGQHELITWHLKIDQISDELEALLLKLHNSLKNLYLHILTVEDPGLDDLENQISQIKNLTDIDKGVEALAQHKVKMFGGTYLFWKRELPHVDMDDINNHPFPVMRYTSCLMVVLGIIPEEESNFSVRVFTGPEPPQQFSEADIPFNWIDFVQVDKLTVWSRRKAEKCDEDIPF